MQVSGSGIVDKHEVCTILYGPWSARSTLYYQEHDQVTAQKGMQQDKKSDFVMLI